MPTIPADAARHFLALLMERHDAPAPLAARWADRLVETSLLGIDTHGIRMADRYLAHVRQGGIAPAATPAVRRDDGATLLLDAQHGLGHVSADAATRLGIERAQAHGVACVRVTDTNHAGALALYVRAAAAADCVGLAMATSIAKVAPWGGCAARVGLNPIAIGAPATPGVPFCLDVATTVTAMGRVTKAQDLGRPIPEGWALDAAGRPTTDPAAVHTLLPMGDHKGYGLALALEILAGLLGGGRAATEVRSWVDEPEAPMGAGFTLLVLDVSRFQEPDAFRHALTGWLAGITGSPVREGFSRITYPGQRSAETRTRRLADGIPLDEHTAAAYRALAQAHDVPMPEGVR